MFLHLPPAVRINPVQSWPSSASRFSRPDRQPLVLSLQQFNQVFLVERSWAGIRNVALSADGVCTAALGHSEPGAQGSSHHRMGHASHWAATGSQSRSQNCWSSRWEKDIVKNSGKPQGWEFLPTVYELSRLEFFLLEHLRRNMLITIYRERIKSYIFKTSVISRQTKALFIFLPFTFMWLCEAFVWN